MMMAKYKKNCHTGKGKHNTQYWPKRYAGEMYNIGKITAKCKEVEYM